MYWRCYLYKILWCLRCWQITSERANITRGITEGGLPNCATNCKLRWQCGRSLDSKRVPPNALDRAINRKCHHVASSVNTNRDLHKNCFPQYCGWGEGSDGRCQKCLPGTFQSGNDYYCSTCSFCKNRQTTKECTLTQDTECGDCLPGWVLQQWNYWSFKGNCLPLPTPHEKEGYHQKDMNPSKYCPPATISVE